MARNQYTQKVSDSSSRKVLMEQLYQRCHGPAVAVPRRFHRFRFLRKKYSWLFVTGVANLTKRSLDIAVSAFALMIFSPLFAVVALAIKFEDGGPVLFCQNRVGKGGRAFVCPKFRSMRVEAEEIKGQLKSRSHHGDSLTFKVKDDPRVTNIGRILRRSSIDEMPQFWSVLKGDMSLVGPRPALPDEVAAYTVRERRRLAVKPGLTCIWQVSGRGDIPFDEQVKLDVQYIESQNLWLDLKLLAKTVPAVLFGWGAY